MVLIEAGETGEAGVVQFAMNVLPQFLRAPSISVQDTTELSTLLRVPQADEGGPRVPAEMWPQSHSVPGNLEQQVLGLASSVIPLLAPGPHVFRQGFRIYLRVSV